MGIVQIPLGLTLYGSPKSLFIVYAIGAFAYLAALFVLSYLYDTEGHHTGSESDSRISGPPPEGGSHHHFGRMAAAGAAGLGLAEIFRRHRRSKNRSEIYDDSQTSYSDEKRTDDESHHGWGHKFLKIGAVVGGLALLKKFFDRRRGRESDTESGQYRPAHTRSDSMTEESLSRLEDGRRPEPSYMPPGRPPSRPPSRTQSPGSSYYYNSAYFTEDDGGKSHGIRNAFLGAGALAAVKKIFGRNKDDDEQRRVEEMRRRDREDERLARANSKRRHSGGGHDGPYRRAASYTAADTSFDATRPPHGPSHGEPVASGAVDTPYSDIPPIPPAHQNRFSGATGQHPSEHDTAGLGAGAAGAAGAAMGEAYAHRRPRSSSRHREEGVESPASPPVSVKVKMHDDGRHVTLRRLTEEEAAANRDSRRRDRRSSRRRTGSTGSLSGGSSDRWRRVEELERRQAEQVQREQEAAAAAAAANNSIAQSGSYPASSFVPQSHMNPPAPPPPHPPPSMPYGSVTSPGTWTGTDASGDYANNRRRRRAERARARQERQGHSVEFT